MIDQALHPKEWKVADLRPDPKNARKHSRRNLDAIKASLQNHGQVKPIVGLDDGTIIAGSGTLLGATELGWETLAVVTFKDRAQAAAYAIADNRTAELGAWDNAQLMETLKDIQVDGFEIDGLGFSPTELDAMLAAGPGNPYKSGGSGKAGSLAQRFLVPPFSVMDSKQGYWQDRKKALLGAMGEAGQSREGKLGHNSMLAHINNGVSLLDPVLAEALLYWFSPGPGRVLDPFAGDLVFGWMAKKMGHDFLGIELRQEQAHLNQERCNALASDGTALYVVDTSENVDKHVEDETVDFLFSCPPYFDLEVYSDDPKDLSAQPDYLTFKDLIASILEKCAAKLKPNRFAALVVGEIRADSGNYHHFVPNMIDAMNEAGLNYYNEIILLNAIGSAQFRANNLMKSRKVVKVHQNVLIFYKGNPKDIPTHFPRIEVGDTEAQA